jgi:hypothetical protein
MAGRPIYAPPCLHDSAILLDLLRRSFQVSGVGGEAAAGFAFDMCRRSGEFGVLLFVYECLEYFVSCRVQKYFVRDGLRFHLSALLRLNFVLCNGA